MLCRIEHNVAKLWGAPRSLSGGIFAALTLVFREP